MEIVVTGRHDFASDNVAGVMPEVLDALAVANVGVASGYGDDRVTRQACDMIRGALDADAEVRFMTSGTAANALALAMLAGPHEAVLAHKHAHVCTDETGAPAFFGGGMGVVGLPGASGQIDADALVAALDEPDTAHSQPAAALSPTQVSEYGTLCPEAALAALAAEAKARGNRQHHGTLTSGRQRDPGFALSQTRPSPGRIRDQKARKENEFAKRTAKCRL